MNETQQKNDGGSADYYQLPLGAAELQDLIEHKGMNFAVGNIFKATYRLGAENSLSDRARDLRKIQWFAERELQRLTPRKTAADYTPLSPSEAKALADSISPPSLCGTCIRQGCPATNSTDCGSYLPPKEEGAVEQASKWPDPTKPAVFGAFIPHEPESAPLSLSLPSITVEGDLEEVRKKCEEEAKEWGDCYWGSINGAVEAWDFIQARQTFTERGGDPISLRCGDIIGELQRMRKDNPEMVEAAKRAVLIKNACRTRPNGGTGYYAPEVCERIILSGGKDW